MRLFSGSSLLPNALVSVLYVVYLRAVGGEVGATSSLAPKIGPLGLVSITEGETAILTQSLVLVP